MTPFAILAMSTANFISILTLGTPFWINITIKGTSIADWAVLTLISTLFIIISARCTSFWYGTFLGAFCSSWADSALPLSDRVIECAGGTRFRMLASTLDAVKTGGTFNTAFFFALPEKAVSASFLLFLQLNGLGLESKCAQDESDF